MREINGSPAAVQLLSSCGQQISQVVRGGNAILSEGERSEVLQSAMSYYPNDLVVVGWNAAFVYDSMAGSETTMQLLEYANSQLLEFRHYDELLTRELTSVYEFGYVEQNCLQPRSFSRQAPAPKQRGLLSQRIWGTGVRAMDCGQASLHIKQAQSGDAVLLKQSLVYILFLQLLDLRGGHFAAIGG
jgi:hypothetical protein